MQLTLSVLLGKVKWLWIDLQRSYEVCLVDLMCYMRGWVRYIDSCLQYMTVQVIGWLTVVVVVVVYTCRLLCREICGCISPLAEPTAEACQSQLLIVLLALKAFLPLSLSPSSQLSPLPFPNALLSLYATHRCCCVVLLSPSSCWRK